MKKFVIAVALLGLGACASDNMAQPTPAAAPAPQQAAAPAAPAARMATTTVANVRVYRTASTRTPTTQRLARGAQVEVVNTNAQWTEIRTATGTGFVQTRSLRMS